MAQLLTFNAIDKNNKSVNFPAYGWPHAEAIASTRGYTDVGILIAELSAKFDKRGRKCSLKTHKQPTNLSTKSRLG